MTIDFLDFVGQGSPFGAGGAGGGFALGPVNNLFGATSGDATESPSTVSPAANRAAAEAVRDAYATANPSWLAQYDGNSNLNIRLFYLSSGSTVIVHQIRQGAAWRDNATATGVQGQPGSATDFSGVGSYNVPLVGAGPGFAPIPSGIRRLANGTGDLESETTIIVQGESIQIGFSGLLSALGAVPMFRSFVTGRRGTFPFTYFDPATGSERTVEIEMQPGINQPIQGDDSTNITASGTYDIPVTANSVVYQLRFRTPVGTGLTAFRFSITAEGQSEPFFYHPSRVSFEDGTGENVGDTGSDPNEHIINLINAPLAIPETVSNLTLDYRFDSGTVLGNSAGDPYITIDRMQVSLEPLALQREIFGLNIVQALSADVTITSANASTYERKLLYTANTETTDITVTISDDLDLDGFSVYAYGSGSITVQGESLTTIDGNASVTFESNQGGVLVQEPNALNSYGLVYASGSDSTLTVQDEGADLATAATTLNFTGSGVTASGTGATKTINIPGGSGTSGVTVQDEGTPLTTIAETLNFTGEGITATGDTATKIINVPGLTVQDEGVVLSGAAGTLNFVGADVVVTGTGAVKTITIGSTPPQADHTNYIDVTADTAASSVDINTAVSSDDLNPTVTLETFTGNNYIQVLQSQAHTRFTSIVISGINQLGGFTINDDARTISGQAYRQYVTTNLVTDALSGAQVIFGGAA